MLTQQVADKVEDHIGLGESFGYSPKELEAFAEAFVKEDTALSGIDFETQDQITVSVFPLSKSADNRLGEFIPLGDQFAGLSVSKKRQVANFLKPKRFGDASDLTLTYYPGEERFRLERDHQPR